MPEIKPYKLHRTWHLAKMLDKLEALGEVKWSYRYDAPNSRALFTVAVSGNDPVTLQTREAEKFTQKITNSLRIPWIPVPHWGGEDRWQETVKRIESMKNGQEPLPWE